MAGISKLQIGRILFGFIAISIALGKPIFGQTVESIISDWNSRRVMIDSVRYDMAGTIYMSKGGYYPPDRQLEFPIPATDVEENGDMVVVAKFRTRKMSIGVNGVVISSEDGKANTNHRLHFFDGQSVARYEPSDLNAYRDYGISGNTPKFRRLRQNSSQTRRFMTPQVAAIFLAHGLAYEISSLEEVFSPSFSPSEFAILAQTDDVTRLEMEMSGGHRRVFEVENQPGHQSAITLFEHWLKSGLLFRVQIEYSNHDGYYLPTSWVFEEYGGLEKPRITHVAEVAKIEINIDLEDKDFFPVLRVGDKILDEESGKHLEVSSDGKTLLEYDPGISPNPSFCRWPIYWGIGLAGVLLLGVGIWFRQRGMKGMDQ